MHARRTLLKLAAAALAAALSPVAVAVRAPVLAPGRALPRPVPAGGGMYLVNGWLLSADDLRRLGLDDL